MSKRIKIIIAVVLITDAIIFSGFYYWKIRKVAPIEIAQVQTQANHSEAKDLELIDGCEGESCGCVSSTETKTNKKFSVFEKMSKKSNKLGDFSEGIEAKMGKIYTLVLDPGLSEVLEVISSDEKHYKVGDKLTHIFSNGEGDMSAEPYGFVSGDILLKEIRPPNYEMWVEITVGDIHGYTDVIPFLGCLE